MTIDADIKGGAGEFEAAVIAVVLDRIAADEEAARRGTGANQPSLPAWIRAILPEESNNPWERVTPD